MGVIGFRVICCLIIPTVMGVIGFRVIGCLVIPTAHNEFKLFFVDSYTLKHIIYHSFIFCVFFLYRIYSALITPLFSFAGV